MSQIPNSSSGLVVPPDQPLDTIVASLMQTIARKGRGFVLSQTDGKIEVAESPAPLPLRDEYVPPAGLRNHQLHDTDSFIGYVKKYGEPADSLIFYNEQGAAVVLYEYQRSIEGRSVEGEPKEGVFTEARGRREIASLAFKAADDWRAWSKLLGKAVDHRTLFKFILNHEHNLGDPQILLALGSIKVNSQVNYESDIQDLGETVGMMFKTNAGEELKKFPKYIGIVLPVLDEDTDGDRWATATLTLQCNMPAGPTEKPTFVLTCSKWRQMYLARVKAEGQKIATELGADWTVLHGEHAYLAPASSVICSWFISKAELMAHDDDDDDDND